MPVDVEKIHVGPGVLTLTPLPLDGGGTPVTVEASTSGGVLAYAREITDIEIAEELNAVDMFVNGEEVQFTIACRELDADRLNLHFGHGRTEEVAAAADAAGYEEATFGGSYQINRYQLEYVVPQRVNPELNYIIHLRAVVPVPSGDIAFLRTGPTEIPMTFRGRADLTQPRGERLGYVRRETAVALGDGDGDGGDGV